MDEAGPGPRQDGNVLEVHLRRDDIRLPRADMSLSTYNRRKSYCAIS